MSVAPTTFRMEVWGPPVAQGRGRAVRIGQGVRVVDPEKSRKWKRTAADFMRLEMRRAGLPPFACPLELTVRGWWPCPVDRHLKRKPRAARRRAKIPDADNLAKAVQDAGNGVIWIDDALIVRLIVEKYEAAQNEKARVELEVRPIPEDLEP